ncbi:sensor histidine kinase [Bacillus sp. B1-b2]|uniref:sensor histidine kinase n=1 Tax=Bacillus sp. B1-b2 TaxID=2653201 RepID=UPI001261F11F|nr:histidine kinase dimerization/phospho-acceptor domain-containing protein [Bacillus sp. B1-b2]KAB7671998.1 sensor histidine kinase [Bacillus sp. B1-b2]
MATKWKNRTLFVLWVMLLTYGLSSISLMITWVNQYGYTDYFQTSRFYEKVEQFEEYLKNYELNYVPIEEVKKNITVSDEEIKAYQYYYGTLAEQITNINGQYEEKIQEARLNDKKEEEEKYIAERDAKIIEITKNFEDKEYVSDKVRKEKEEQLQSYYQDLQDGKKYNYTLNSTFHYYFKNTATGKEYTNISKTESQESENQAYIKEYYLEYNPNEILEKINWSLLWYSDEAEPVYDSENDSNANDGHLEGYITVPKQFSERTELKSEIAAFEKEKQIIGIYSIAALASLVIFCFVTIRYRRLLKKSTVGTWYMRIPVDIRAVIFITTFILALILAIHSGDQLILYISNQLQVLSDIIGLYIVSFGTMNLFVFQAIYFYLNREKRSVKELWKSTFAYKIMQITTYRVHALLADKTLTSRTLFSVFVLAIALLFTLMSLPFEMMVIYFLLYIFLIIPILISIVKKARDLEKVLKYSNLIATGDNPKEINEMKDRDLKQLLENINILKNGVIVSQNAQVKSERLKTELITNVSHDLRTPLTSIINYTDLLKNQQLSAEEREGYLTIIDRKSQRLKVLIDDLFEVSKMASGNIELKREKINLVQLLQQALGEYDENINASTLEFKVSQQEDAIYSYVDGQKMWRVFDNLIGNILKYSLENTRVYISLKLEQDYAVMQFKNISKYELDDHMDELFERFKRGDTSRNTEGSGLGLAIAKSIVDLHAGSLIIDTDGDLFKVTLKIKTSNHD